MRTKVFDNGLRLAMQYLPGYRSVSIGIWVKAGSVNEDEGSGGMAHAIEHMLFKGTTRRSAADLADEMTEIGGSVDAFTTKEYTCYYARTLSENLERAVDILTDMILHSRLDDEDLAKELQVISEEIDMYDDSPEDIVQERLQEQIWQGHPLRSLISGSKAVVTNFTSADMKDFMARYYVGSRMVITIVGAFDEDAAARLIREAFKELPRGEADINEPGPALYHPALYYKHKDIEQLHMILAYPSPVYNSPDRYTLSLAGSILGGNVNSRLFQKIREELGLSYAIYSYGSSYECGGLYHIYAAISPDQLEETALAVCRVVKEMRTQPVSEKELRITKAQIKSELVIADESTYERMSSLGKYLIHGEEPLEAEAVLNAVDAVTAEDILTFMQTWFRPDRLSFSVVGAPEGMDGTALKGLWRRLQEEG